MTKTVPDATVSVTLTGADLDLLLVALCSRRAGLMDAWHEAVARGGDAQAQAQAQVREIGHLLGRINHLARALCEAASARATGEA